jgi:hypothetical protein
VPQDPAQDHLEIDAKSLDIISADAEISAVAFQAARALK